jgi:phage tail sheath protein FI
MKKNTDGNIWDAAFGIDTGVIPLEGLVYDLDEPTQELLAQAEINPIINKPGVGTVIWGGRTLQPYDSARSWLNVRELLNMSEQANLDYLERFIGKNNTPFTRLQVKSGLDAHYGPLIGDAYSDALVVCDDSNNPGAVIDAGELHVDVYNQPVRPINRIVLQIVITRTGISLTEVAAGVAA